jgi:hypothetical protein
MTSAVTFQIYKSWNMISGSVNAFAVVCTAVPVIIANVVRWIIALAVLIAAKDTQCIDNFARWVPITTYVDLGIASWYIFLCVLMICGGNDWINRSLLILVGSSSFISMALGGWYGVGIWLISETSCSDTNVIGGAKALLVINGLCLLVGACVLIYAFAAATLTIANLAAKCVQHVREGQP